MLVTKCTVQSIDERERWIEQLRQPREPLFILSRLNWVASYKFAFKSNQDFLKPLTSNRSSLLLYPLFLSVFLRHDYDGCIFEQTDVPQRRNIWRSQFAYSQGSMYIFDLFRVLSSDRHSSSFEYATVIRIRIGTYVLLSFLSANNLFLTAVRCYDFFITTKQDIGKYSHWTFIFMPSFRRCRHRSRG